MNYAIGFVAGFVACILLVLAAARLITKDRDWDEHK